VNLVLDASMAASWCFPDERTDLTQRLLNDLAGPEAAAAPRMWAYEIRNVVLRGVRQERLGHKDAAAFLESLTALRIRLLDPPYGSVFEAALRFDLSFYDAAYLELALREHLPLATLDKRLRRAALAANVAVYGEGS
jgi:predicted nucleic acid-binding protein